MERIRIGKSGSDYALWISKPGALSTSTNDDDFLVSPNKILSQPYASGVVTSVTNQPYTQNYRTYAQAVIAHNLGYIPVCLGFGEDSNGNPVCIGADSTNCYISGKTTTSGTNTGDNKVSTVNWFYVIFRTKLG